MTQVELTFLNSTSKRRNSRSLRFTSWDLRLRDHGLGLGASLGFGAQGLCGVLGLMVEDS